MNDLSHRRSRLSEVDKLRRINAALIDRVERSTDQQGNAYALFQTAISLEDTVRQRTLELSTTLRDLEQTNRALIRARDSAEQANRSKTRFLASASHDVLQPLNAALLLLTSLKGLQTSAEGERLCVQIERSLETMDVLLRNLMYMSRLDTGDIKPKRETVCIGELLFALASDFNAVAELRGLELRVVASNTSVRTDRMMLRRILQNLLSNALRYTRSGGVLLGTSVVGERVFIRVADTGIGIPESTREEVFQEFYRGAHAFDDESVSSLGMGLGLAIVERMVRELKCPLELHSRVGQGTCFRLELPLCTAQENTTEFECDGVPGQKGMDSEHSALTHPTRVNVKVLLIENDRDTLHAMEQLLQAWGCDLKACTSTAEAVDLQQEWIDWTPEIIVADQHLDGNDRGTTAIRRLRQAAGRQIPAIIITAEASDDLWIKTDQWGIELMHKPVKPAQLRALMNHLTSLKPA